MAMKHVQILIFVLVVGVGVGVGSWLVSRPARAGNEADQPPAPAAGPTERYKILPRVGTATDDVQMLDTATGKLYGLRQREKVKDKEPPYEWYLLADAPK
jgi:hypothetical protein